MLRTRLITAAFAAAGFATIAGAAPTITVTPSLAPNKFGSSNWSTYVANSISAQYNFASSWGTAGTPGYYEALSGPLSVKDNIVTGFVSWRGDANPAAPYNGEYGNRLQFGVHIMGNGTKFSISQMGFDSISSDVGDALGFSFGVGSYNYSSEYVGIDYVDGIRGNGNDVLVTSGSNTQLIDELVGRGSGNAFAVYDDGSTPHQQLIDDAVASIDPYTYTGTYYLDGLGVSGHGTAVVPEPTTMLALGIGAVGMIRRRKKS